VLLLDEPSNHLDLEATLWLENFLKTYAGTLIVISHERDLLNNVVDTILHLQGGRLTEGAPRKVGQTPALPKTVLTIFEAPS
jgi:ATPase subunit of ABC transporter with duplicated ATPase domains